MVFFTAWLPYARRGRSNAAASDLHKEVDAREGAVVGQAAGLASGARCQI